MKWGRGVTAWGKGTRRRGYILSRPPISTICVCLHCPTSSMCVCCLVYKRVHLQPSCYSFHFIHPTQWTKLGVRAAVKSCLTPECLMHLSHSQLHELHVRVRLWCFLKYMAKTCICADLCLSQICTCLDVIQSLGLCLSLLRDTLKGQLASEPAETLIHDSTQDIISTLLGN